MVKHRHKRVIVMLGFNISIDDYQTTQKLEITNGRVKPYIFLLEMHCRGALQSGLNLR